MNDAQAEQREDTRPLCTNLLIQTAGRGWEEGKEEAGVNRLKQPKVILTGRVPSQGPLAGLFLRWG